MSFFAIKSLPLAKVTSAPRLTLGRGGPLSSRCQIVQNYPSEEMASTILIQSSGSRFSGLRSAQPSSNPGCPMEISFDADSFHLSRCQPDTRDILEGGLERSVLIFLLRFAKQCLVIILNSCLFVPSASGLVAGFRTTSLDCTRGDGLNELGDTLLSMETSKSSQRFSPNSCRQAFLSRSKLTVASLLQTKKLFLRCWKRTSNTSRCANPLMK